MTPERPRRKHARHPAPAHRTDRRPNVERLTAALEQHALKIAIALVLLASVRIAATYDVFSHTIDEPGHLAAGMEWLDRGCCSYDLGHPPLARILAALGPRLLGRHSHGSNPNAAAPDPAPVEGIKVLYENNGTSYDTTLFAARLGVLPFFWIAAAVVWVWAKRDFNGRTAVAAVFVFSFLPPVLAHAGLVTTDMAVTACLGAAFLSGRVWLEGPTLRRGLLFGVCGGLALVSKFSSLVYFPAVAVFAVGISAATGALSLKHAAQSLKERLPSLAAAIGVAGLIVWAAYRFSFGPSAALGHSVPAPKFFDGIRVLMDHNAAGYTSYLLGKVSANGFPGYYFVVLAVKTPLAFLACAIAGIAIVWRNRKDHPAWLLPLAYTAGILAVSFFSRINIGVRHILPVYTGLSILAAISILHLLDARRTEMAAAAAVLLGWLSLSSLASHPDYLPYFNELAGSHPENILVDSDLDWGQDMKRLEQRLQSAGARSLSISSVYYIAQHPGLPRARAGKPDTPVTGWNAVSLTMWKKFRFGHGAANPEKTFWPDWKDRYPPQEIIGKSIYLWYFPPSAGLPRE